MEVAVGLLELFGRVKVVGEVSWGQDVETEGRDEQMKLGY